MSSPSPFTTTTAPPVGTEGQQDPPEQRPDVIQVPKEEPSQTDEQKAEQQRQERLRDPDTGRFTTDDMAKARQQEKDKLYPRLTQMEEEVAQLRKEREERLAEEQKRQSEQDEIARKQQEEELGVRELLTKKEQEWADRFNRIEEEREKDKAIFEAEGRFREIEDYRTNRLTEEEDGIMPELRDLVAGTTKEEIDSSITVLKDRTARILQQVSATQQSQHQEMRGASVTSPPMGPMEQQGEYETLSPDDIRGMSMAEYSKRRSSLLGAAAQQQRKDRGLMG